MRCDIDTSTTVTLNLDIPTFQVVQAALSFYVEKGNLPPGAVARELMWKFAAMLTQLAKGNKQETLPALTAPPPAPSAAPALPPPQPVGNPTPPLAETVSLATVEAPDEENWENEEEEIGT